MGDKLGRYKKGPVVKLPKGLGSKKAVESEKKICNDDDDDDDFQVPSKKIGLKKSDSEQSSPEVDKNIVVASSKWKTRQRRVKKKDDELFLANAKPSSASSDRRKEKTSELSKCSGSSEVHNFLQQSIPERPKEKEVEFDLFNLLNNVGENEAEEPEQLGHILPENSTKTKDAETLESQVSKADNLEEPAVIDTNAVVSSKVCCPFCWKKLGDKLTLATHVKQCGKDLPTERLFEAVALQEKQVAEWAELGVAYPAFLVQPQQQKKPATKARKKKTPAANQQVNQEELDLAIALSESLHEELCRRKSGGSVKEMLKQQQTRQPQQPAALGGRRRNNKQRTQAKLFTATEEQKVQNIEQRLGAVIDANVKQSSEDDGEFFVREKLDLAATTGVTGRLKQFVNHETKLWKISSDGEANRSHFETQVVADSKAKWAEESKILRQNAEKLETSKKSPVVVEPVWPTRKEFQGSSVAPEKIERPALRKNLRNRKSVDSGADILSNVSTSDQPTTKSLTKGVEKLSNDLLRLLRNKKHADLIIYGKEEKGIRVHRLLFEARCPNLLDEVVTEQKASGGERAVVALTCFTTSALKAFVQWVYGGAVEPQLMKKNLGELQELELKFKVDVGTSEFQQSDEVTLTIVEESDSRKDSLKICTTAPVTTEESESANTSLPLRRVSDQKRQSYFLSSNHVASTNTSSVDIFAPSQERDLFSEIESPNLPVTEAEKSISLEDQLFIISSQDDDMFRDLAEPTVDIKTNSSSSTAAANPADFSSPVTNTRKSKSICEPDISVIVIDDDDNDSCRLSNGSRDLFEDSEEEEVNVTFVSQKDQSFNCEKRDSFDLFFDEEIRTQKSDAVMLSPKPYMSKAGKRDRSLSPVNRPRKSLISPEKYTATQFAQTMESERIRSTAVNKLGGVHNWTHQTSPAPNLFQATKKQKFNSNINNGLVVPSVHFNDDSLLSVDLPVDSNNSSPHHNLSLPFQTNAILNNVPSIPDPSDDFFPGGDSILFANMPSVILNENDHHEKEETLSSLRGRPTQKQKKKTGKRKSLSQQSRAPPTTDFNCFTPSKMSPTGGGDGINLANANGNPCRTPLLNYSLVDTPILKKELKKFGLKPLPRSKAKKILRHIYQETHK